MKNRVEPQFIKPHVNGWLKQPLGPWRLIGNQWLRLYEDSPGDVLGVICWGPKVMA